MQRLCVCVCVCVCVCEIAQPLMTFASLHRLEHENIFFFRNCVLLQLFSHPMNFIGCDPEPKS